MKASPVSARTLVLLLAGCIAIAGCGNDPATTRATETTAQLTSSSIATSPTALRTTTSTPTTSPATTSVVASTSAAPTTNPPADTNPATTAPKPSPAPRGGDEYFFNQYGSRYAAFKSPSGNIGCDIRDGTAACIMGENSWDVPPPDEYCDATWGISVEVANGAGRLTCVGGMLSEGPVLPYGHEIEFGPVLCRSEESGVTCERQDTGHGFKVNRASFDLY